MKNNSQRGFTLIELMVVVAVIGILATLGITNFAGAIKKARDAKKQSDIVAMQKALETCYNVGTAKYGTATDTWGSSTTDTALNGQMVQAGCLNAPVIAANSSYPYTGAIKQNADQTQWFFACAQLEMAGTGNSTTPTPTSVTADSACDESKTPAQKKTNNCNYFCVFSSQGK